ncbi:UNVERIFIED_ORG: hypothetical protein BDU10_9561 [Burkholderia sp. CF145]
MCFVISGIPGFFHELSVTTASDKTGRLVDEGKRVSSGKVPH